MKTAVIPALAACFFLSLSVHAAQGTRKAVFAGQFYDRDAAALSERIAGFLAAAKSTSIPQGRIRALIVPHAGYVYSGAVAGEAYQRARGQAVETVVILGPSHRVGFEGCSIYPEGGFETPLGVAGVDEALARALAKASGFGFIPEAHADEHSVEVQVPFIQTVWPKAKIVPIVMGVPAGRTVASLALALEKTLKDKNALVIASTDMSHFFSKTEANALDKTTIDLVQNQKVSALLRKIERGDNILCGGAPVAAALLYAQKLGRAAVTILSYADSAQAGGPEDRVVGYFSAAVTAGPASAPAAPEESGRAAIEDPDTGREDFLSGEAKTELLSLARRAVESFVRDRRTIAFETSDSNFLARRGAFVTLTKKGELRGCIGFIEPVMSLSQTVLQCAIYAASEDPRFSPVRPAELKDLSYEISVLTPLRKVEDPKRIQVGRHGLVISQGERRGLLLPQVATENRWDREEFLRETCLKAGLAPCAWKKGADIYVFEAIVFR